jgi:hypothetical protein
MYRRYKDSWHGRHGGWGVGEIGENRQARRCKGEGRRRQEENGKEVQKKRRGGGWKTLEKVLLQNVAAHNVNVTGRVCYIT